MKQFLGMKNRLYSRHTPNEKQILSFHNYLFYYRNKKIHVYMSELQVYCTVVFLTVKIEYLGFHSTNSYDFFTISSTYYSPLPYHTKNRKGIMNLSGDIDCTRLNLPISIGSSRIKSCVTSWLFVI